ncbi:lactonase family protein [Croceitalea dokdonensis]|nr:lactonase family protein [Croceitalea dokdonensis]
MRCNFSFCLIVITFLMGCQEKRLPMETYDVFVGTYTDGTSKGIYKLTFDATQGTLGAKELMAALPNPSFLALTENKDYLYAVQETADFDSLGGGVTAFSIKDGLFKEINSKGSGGAHPCHVAVSGNGQLAVSNYTGGNLAVFDLAEDGGLADRQVLDHKTEDTTVAPHVHKAHFNSDGLFVADLGLDAIKRYQKQPYGWIPANQASIAMVKGAGPRHFVFNGNQQFLYVINELNSTITVLQRDKEGNYQPQQTVPTLAADFNGKNSCADIHLSQDGRFLYGSNRGENTIVVFAVNQENGKLTQVGRTSVGGEQPRNFTLDPSGNYLLVANKRSNNITVFARDKEKGTLSFLHEVEIGSPVCLVFG